MPAVRATLRCAFILLFLSCNRSYFLTSTDPMRDLHDPISAVNLEVLEKREDIAGRCSDLILRDQSIERWKNNKGGEFTLGVIELNDKGEFAVKGQEQKVLDELRATAMASHGALVVTFVHGWHHRPKVCDNNLACFRRVLRALSDSSVRPVFGVYVGWRGDSWLKPSLVSFWDRKSTAHGIGQKSGHDVLVRLNEEYERLNKELDPAGHPVTMVTIGHSFGAALVYSAIENTLASEPNATTHTFAGMGDLVVLVNPAFEAHRYRKFAEEVRRHRAANDQLPVLLTVASEGDWAVKYTFPIGRSLYFITHPWAFGGKDDVIGAGHYAPQVTHELRLIDARGQVVEKAEQPPKPHTLKATGKVKEQCDLHEHDLATCMCEYIVPDNLADALQGDHQSLVTESSGIIVISDNERVELRHDPSIDPHAPFIVARASVDVIPGHNDIYTPRFVIFLTGYIRSYLNEASKRLPAATLAAQATTP